MDAAQFPSCAPITARTNMMLQVTVGGKKTLGAAYMVKYRFAGSFRPCAAISRWVRTSKRSARRAGLGEGCPKTGGK